MKIKQALQPQHRLQSTDLDGFVGENRVTRAGMPIRTNVQSGHDCWKDENGKEHCSAGV